MPSGHSGTVVGTTDIPSPGPPPKGPLPATPKK